MSGKNSHLTPLESRKQLLIAESELNRAQMAEDITTFVAYVHAFNDKAKSLRSIAASAAALIAGVVAFRRHKSEEADPNPSWMKTALKGVGLVSTVWKAFRARGQNEDNRPPESFP